METREYDESNRLELLEQTHNGEVVASYDYELDDAGHRVTVTENGETVEYEYDDLGRLTEERFDGRTVSYEYDDVGNRLKRVDSAQGETTYVYDENDRLLESTANGVVTTYEYDDNGNLTSQTTNGKETTYTWDDRNRLVEVNTADGDTVVYEYDDENVRVSSTVNGAKTIYLVDSNRPYAQVLEEYEDENLKVRYVHGLDLISVERDGEVSVYLVDGLGSTRVLTDLDGEVVATYTYDAFGELLDSTGEVENDYLFAGEQFDGELDQYYLRQRFYDAGVGRFTRRDTYEGRIGEPVTLHKYLYGNGNPVNFTDPSGLISIDITAGLAIRSIVAGSSVAYYAGTPLFTNLLTTQSSEEPPLRNKVIVEVYQTSSFWGHTSININGIVYNQGGADRQVGEQGYSGFLWGRGVFVREPEARFYASLSSQGPLTLQRYSIDLNEVDTQRLFNGLEAEFNNGSVIEGFDPNTRRLRDYHFLWGNCTTTTNNYLPIYLTLPVPVAGWFSPHHAAASLNILSLFPRSGVTRLRDRSIPGGN